MACKVLRVMIPSSCSPLQFDREISLACLDIYLTNFGRSSLEMRQPQRKEWLMSHCHLSVHPFIFNSTNPRVLQPGERGQSLLWTMRDGSQPQNLSFLSRSWK